MTTDRVRMEHPDLPGRPIHVRQAAVAHHQTSGWRIAPAVQPKAAPAVSTPPDTADTAAEADGHAPKRRRSTPTDQKEQDA